MDKIHRKLPLLGSFAFSVIFATYLSYLTVHGSVVAKSYLSEQLQPKHFELYVYVLVTIQGLAIAFSCRGRQTMSNALVTTNKFILGIYSGVIGSIIGWGIGAILADWNKVPFSGWLIFALFLLLSYLPYYWADSVEEIVRKTAEFSIKGRKHEQVVRILGFTISAYGIYCLATYLGFI